ncbi:phosphatase PAP2 family protein [Actinoplanes lobatus]|uniref:Phosphatase PAP2 family protein n=2 Tax=Actinoplanes lobatus TaxID=113568 RepID=A0ABQ4AJ78_9ACTN|nr:phosphatase PAP2 family protein [Actinoplanes lobatus]GIE41033.1 phosphatase PAP2 family protein [Actinoplanes lobatus]
MGMAIETRIENVPDVAGGWYRAIVEWAATTPEFVQGFMAHFTELGVALLAGMWALTLWRARRSPALTRVLAGGVGVVLAYGLSEWSKTYLDAERPCRTFPDLPIVASECPPTGDWSFPSNHSTVAAALVVAILLVSWRTGLLALPVGLLAGFSRVFVGVHYPHDVVAGFLIGAVATAIAVTLLPRLPLIRAFQPGTREARPAPGSAVRGGPGSR